MNDQNLMAHCRSYIDCQITRRERAGPYSSRPVRLCPSVTISRQTGAGGSSVADLLARYLQKHGPEGESPWTVFSRNLMEKVMEDHDLPKRLAKYLPEKHTSMIAEIMEELLGLHPPSWTLLRQTTETILHLAEQGHVIILGRGGNVITSRMEQVFHVRLIAPLEVRIERVCRLLSLSVEEARAHIKEQDTGRREYMSTLFKADIDDPNLYHLVINTGRISYQQTADIIGEAVLKFRTSDVEKTNHGTMAFSRD